MPLEKKQGGMGGANRRRNPSVGSTGPETMAFIFNLQCGFGMLSLPAAFAKAGSGLSSIFLLVLCAFA